MVPAPEDASPPRPLRVPMREPMRVLDGYDVALHMSPRNGTRFSMDVSDEMLFQLGKHVLPFVVQTLSERVAHTELHNVGDAVHEQLRDRQWLMPILEEEIRRSVREAVAVMFKDSEKWASFRGAIALVEYLNEQAEDRTDDE